MGVVLIFDSKKQQKGGGENEVKLGKPPQGCIPPIVTETIGWEVKDPGCTILGLGEDSPKK